MLYNKALRAMPRGKPRQAAQALWTLLQQHLDSPLAEQASFLLADAYFAMFSKGAIKSPLPAIEAYRNAIDLYPRSQDVPWARFQIARGNTKMKLYYEASALYRIGIESGLPETWLSWYTVGLGKVLLKTNRLEEAKDKFTEVLSMAPGGDPEKEALFGLCESYCLLGDMNSAEDAYEEAILHWPCGVVGHPRILFIFGHHYLTKAEYEDAVSFLLKLYNLYPERPFSGFVMVYLGDTYRYQGRLSLAGRLYEEAVRSFPSDDTAHQIARFRLADMAYLSQASSFTFGKVGPELFAYRDITSAVDSAFIGQYAQFRYSLGLYSHAGTMTALDELEAFIDRYPDSPLRADIFKALRDIFHQLIQCWYDATDLLTVAIFYERHRRYFLMPPLDMRMIDLIAESYQRLGLYDLSLDVYKHSVSEGGAQLEIESFAFREVHAKLILEEYEDVTELGDIFLKRFHRSEKCAQVKVFIGDAYYNLKAFPEAVSYYKQALEQAPEMEGPARICYRKGNAHRALKEYGPAISAYEKAIEAATRDHFVVDDLYVIEESIYQKAFTHYDAGEYALAEETFAKAHGAYPRNPRAPIALCRRGDAFLKMGRPEEAIQAWKNMVSEHPEDLWRKLVEERIAALANDTVEEEAPQGE